MGLKLKRRQIETNHAVAFLNRLRQYNPDLAEAIYHVPNESKTYTRTDIGIKAGQPDYCLPIPMGIFGALYIELKRPELAGTKNHGLSKAQQTRLPMLAVWNRVVVCYSWQEAIQAVHEYMGLSASI